MPTKGRGPIYYIKYKDTILGAFCWEVRCAEVLASRVYEALRVPHAEYRLDKLYGMLYCSCELPTLMVPSYLYYDCRAVNGQSFFSPGGLAMCNSWAEVLRSINPSALQDFRFDASGVPTKYIEKAHMTIADSLAELG